MSKGQRHGGWRELKEFGEHLVLALLELGMEQGVGEPRQTGARS